MAYLSYSQQDIEKATELYRQHLKLDDIAEELNKDKQTVKRMLKEKGIYKPRHKSKVVSKEQLAKFRNTMRFIKSQPITYIRDMSPEQRARYLSIKTFKITL